MNHNPISVTDIAPIYHIIKGHLVQHSNQMLSPKMVDKISFQIAETVVDFLREKHSRQNNR